MEEGSRDGDRQTHTHRLESTAPCGDWGVSGKPILFPQVILTKTTKGMWW